MRHKHLAALIVTLIVLAVAALLWPRGTHGMAEWTTPMAAALRI